MVYNPLGIRLTVKVGPLIAVPAPPPILLALTKVEVEHASEGRSAFQMTFTIGRSGPADLADYALVASPLLRPWSRVTLIVTFGAVPSVLLDGIVTHHQVQPGVGLSPGTLTITGEDVSVMMDRKEASEAHTGCADPMTVGKVLSKYAQYDVVPAPVPPVFLDIPLPIERNPMQQGTDYQHLVALAADHGHVFFVSSSLVPGKNAAYWGPPLLPLPPQRALTVNMGPETNVDRIDFTNNALTTTIVKGHVQDRQTNQVMPVQTMMSMRVPLSQRPALVENAANAREERLRDGGVNAVQAQGRAQARTDRAADNAVRATGSLDALRYGGFLQPRMLVGLRGAGMSYDGLWVVERVKHVIEPGKQYKQEFSLRRDGLGSLTPVVIP